MLRMLKDKFYSFVQEYYNNNYDKVKRIYNNNNNFITNGYNLFLEPTFIIDNIYLGNAYNASNYNTLTNLDIGLIVNITTEIKNYYPDEFEYLNIKILDKNNENIEPHINKCIDKIISYSDKYPDKNILIHCFMGSSRSAAIATAYYSKKKNMKIDDVVKILQKKRPIININTTFYRNLVSWSKKNVG